MEHPSGIDDNEQPNETPRFTVCSTCEGEGRIHRPPSRKARLQHKRKRESAKNNDEHIPPLPPIAKVCQSCNGSGLLPLAELQSRSSQEESKHEGINVAIIGGGLAGLSLAASLRHRNIQCVVFERDETFDQRHQGYGLTMQQVSKQMKALGIDFHELKDRCIGITSTKHVVHKIDGTVVGQWGMRHWQQEDADNPKSKEDDANQSHVNSKNCNENGTNGESKESKRSNIHIARQVLRYELFKAATVGNPDVVKWNHKLIEYREDESTGSIDLSFQVGDQLRKYSADVVVGADGIRSQIRKQMFLNNDTKPLRYLGCIVILGICPLEEIDITSDHAKSLLDGKTVFQTADGTTRIYMMPFSQTQYMWQLSFPVNSEETAQQMSDAGQASLLQDAYNRCKSWHEPIPQILKLTPIQLCSGYPVYDRPILSKEDFPNTGNRRVALVGDAAHPMSPFKGQGANQAMLDALQLSRSLYSHTVVKEKRKNTDQEGNSQVREPDSITAAILEYEEEMLPRSAVKVQASAEAARFLHSEVAIHEGNMPRGSAAVLVATERKDS